MFSRLLSWSTRGTVKATPPALLALLYAALIVVGAGLLMLPVAAHAPLAWPDALFTATSAVTVTGLSVVDIGSDLTGFGQAVVLILIQLGGLGLMTFAVLVLSLLGLPVTLPHRVFLREDLNQTSIADLLRLVGIIVRVVIACELAGSALLAFVFVPDLGWAAGLWNAVFHAVSAFNNAGFGLFRDSLSRWVTNPLINFTVPALFIIGGIGFSVLSDVYTTRKWHRLSVHTKLMLVGTVVLIVWSVAAFAVLEWSNPLTLGRFDAAGKLVASWFQAVTTRTAGFNTVNIAGIHDSTALMMMSLMLIGGGSTSTAGGIKLTTFIVLLLATVAFFKRRSTLHAFGRSLGHEEVLKVLALTVVSLLVVMLGIFTIMLTHDGDFLDLAFEVASAFGTVGLSRGATAQLDSLGRGVIMLLMFIGRVGPLTLGFFLATRVPARVRYPSSQILLG